MIKIRVSIKIVLFFLMTFGVYSLWFFAPLLASQKRRIQLREFIFEKWAQMFVRLAGAQIEMTGRPPEPPFLLVSNHTSYFDIAVLRSIVTGVFVAKADIANWPVAGRMVGNMGMIFINREQKRDIPRAGSEILAALERGEGVIIFAEGTTGDGQKVLPFKSSFLEFAAANNLPVHFASLTYNTPKGEMPAAEAVCWWRPEENFLSHLCKFFALSGIFCHVTFGDQPIISKNRKELTNRLWQAVSNQFVPVD